MKLITLKLILIFVTVSLNTWCSEISVKVKLSPAGSFNMVFKDVRGSLKKEGNLIKGKKISAKVKTLATGMDLRDEHARDKLEYKKHPRITVTDIVGKNGVGKGKINIKGISKKIVFKYKNLGKGLYITKFPLSLKDFKFSNINYMGVGVTDKVMVTAKIPVN